MKFSYEIPIRYLKNLNKEQDYLFILAHHLHIKEYFKYNKKSKKYKILDNGAYERGESISPKNLKEVAEKLKVNVIVLPDALFNKKRSQELEKEFLSLFNDKNKKNFKFMKVVCGDNLKEYLKSLIEVAKDKNVDIIGLSQSRNMIAPNLTFVINYLHNNCNIGFNKPIHLLGLTNPYELIEAKKFSQIKTIDTGRPINFTFKNKKFPLLKRADEWKKISGEELDTRKKLNIKLAKENIKRLKSYYATY